MVRGLLLDLLIASQLVITLVSQFRHGARSLEVKANHFQCKQLEAVVRRPTDSKRQSSAKGPPNKPQTAVSGMGVDRHKRFSGGWQGASLSQRQHGGLFERALSQGERKELLKDTGP